MRRSATGAPRVAARRGAVRLLPLTLLLLAGCDWPFGPGNDGPPPEITDLPRALSPIEEAVIEGSTRFGFDLLREVVAEEGAGENVVLSPLSASMALGMTLEGAEGETFSQVRNVLGFAGLEREEISSAYRELLDLLYGLDPSVEFRIANSIWHRTGFEPEEEFLAAVREHFDAVVEGLDFSSPDAAPTINDWVNGRTEGRIEEIVEDPIDALTLMFLINALYFNGSWAQAFDPDRTVTAPFDLRDGSTIDVPMMEREVALTPLAHTEEYTAVDLPYGGKAWSMTILRRPDLPSRSNASSAASDPPARRHGPGSAGRGGRHRPGRGHARRPSPCLRGGRTRVVALRGA